MTEGLPAAQHGRGRQTGSPRCLGSLVRGGQFLEKQKDAGSAEWGFQTRAHGDGHTILSHSVMRGPRVCRSAETEVPASVGHCCALCIQVTSVLKWQREPPRVSPGFHPCLPAIPKAP